MDTPSGDAPRQSLLGSINFLNRGNRPRAAAGPPEPSAPPLPPPTSSTTIPAALPPLPSSTSPTSQPATNNNNGHNSNRRRVVAAAGIPAAAAVTPSNAGGLGYMLRRRRSANAVERAQQQQQQQQQQTSAPAATPNGPTHRIRLVPHLDSTRSLHFEAISRDVRQGDSPLRIGRFTEQPGNNSNKLAFKSKVVSRGHAEVWFDSGTFYIKDTKSSSGTFLNHIRLSSPNTESRPFPIKDGDVLQLGVDYQGGTEEIFRCVKMRVELGREWQSGVNAFNSSALAQLKSLASNPADPTSITATIAKSKSKSKTSAASTSVSDCCICLCSVTVCQALFIAPCSHAYHYKCIRPLLQMHHPGFSCPLCRTFADLEADVESVELPGEWEGAGMVLAGRTGMEGAVEGNGAVGGMDAEGDIEMGSGSERQPSPAQDDLNAEPEPSDADYIPSTITTTDPSIDPIHSIIPLSPSPVIPVPTIVPCNLPPNPQPDLEIDTHFPTDVTSYQSDPGASDPEDHERDHDGASTPQNTNLVSSPAGDRVSTDGGLLEGASGGVNGSREGSDGEGPDGEDVGVGEKRKR